MYVVKGEMLESLFTSQQNGMRNYVQALKYEQYFSLSLVPGAQVMAESMHSTSMACFQALLQPGWIMNMHEGEKRRCGGCLLVSPDDFFVSLFCLEGRFICLIFF